MAEIDILKYVTERLFKLATSLKEQLWPLFENRKDALRFGPLHPEVDREMSFLRIAHDRAKMLENELTGSFVRARDEIHKFENGLEWIIRDDLRSAENRLGHGKVKEWLWGLKAFTYDADDVLDELATGASRLRWKDDDDEEDAAAKDRYAPKVKQSCFLNWHDPEVLFIKVAEQMKDVNATLESVREEYRSFDSVLVVSEGGSSDDSRYSKRVRREEIDCEPDEEEKWRRTYNELPPHLKQCLGYCSLFPKSWSYYRTALVNMWIAQGYVLGRENQMLLEDIGGEYFDDLVGRSFFKENDRGCYRMEAVVHDVVTSVWAEECLRIESDDEFAEPKNLRHLSVCSETWPGATALTELRNFKKLRTLLFLSSDFDYSYLLPPNFFVGFECVRVLVLANYGQEKLPPFGFGKMMIHLRYLDASISEMETLPETLCDLHNLQTLILPGYIYYQAPERFCQLVNLRHMHPIFQSIAGIGKLTALQNLGTFVVRKEFGYTIKELKDLSQLRGKLSICQLSLVQDAEEARYACLHNKAHLEKLELSGWDEYDEDGMSDSETDHDGFDVLDSLKPHPNLKKLTIKGYGGSKHPSWMKADYLSNITSITLASCDNLDRLPPLGCLPSLKSLLFEELSGVQRVDREFYGSEKNGQHSIFPSLEVLSFESLHNWVEWEGAENEGQLWFPSLKNLSIFYCRKLKMLPHLPSSLRKLSLNGIGLITLPDIWGCYASNHRGFSFLSSVKIRGCPQLASLEEWLLQHPMPSLSELALADLSLIKSLELKGVVSLEELDISYWPELVAISFHNFALPKKLTIRRFENLMQWPCVSNMGFVFTESEHCSAFPSPGHVVIEDCPELASLGDSFLQLPLPCLLQLELKNLSKIEIISGADLGFLTSLKKLTVWSLRTLKSLELNGLISLDTLEISRCQELAYISFVGLTSLKELRIWDCEILAVRPSQDLIALKRLTVTSCPVFTWMVVDPSELTELSLAFVDLRWRSQDSGWWRWWQNLASLQILSLDNIQNLPSNSLKLQGFSSLEDLTVRSCKDLQSLEGIELLPSLKKLFIQNCPTLEMRYGKGGPDRHKIKHIPQKPIRPY